MATEKISYTYPNKTEEYERNYNGLWAIVCNHSFRQYLILLNCKTYRIKIKMLNVNNDYETCAKKAAYSSKDTCRAHSYKEKFSDVCDRLANQHLFCSSHKMCDRF